MATADYEGMAHVSFIPCAGSQRFNLIARFRDCDTADHALAVLREHGFTAADASLLGTVDDFVHTGSGLTKADECADYSSVHDAMEGMVVGALIGACIGLILFALPFVRATMGAHAEAGSFGVAAIVGAIVGLTLGGLVGGEAGLDRSRAGTDTYDDQHADGIAYVGVHADGERAGVASSDLRSAGALDVSLGVLAWATAG
jgi:hypothetical protein